MKSISKGINVNNINDFKWMYFDMITWKTPKLKRLLNHCWKKTPLPQTMKPPCKLLVRNPKFLSMLNKVSSHPKL